MAITEFRGEYRFLSSFWPCEISHAGMVFPSVENAFQAAKCLHQEDMKKFIHITPGAAKRKGRKVVIRKGWDEIKRTVMANLLIQKFSYPELQELLLATEEEELEEGNTWGDTYWGVVYGPSYSYRIGGENHLGKLLMEIRGRLKNVDTSL